MGARLGKKRLILEYREKHQLATAGVRELRMIQKNLRERAPSAAWPSLGYIAGVLRHAGTHVDYEDRYTGSTLPAPYAARLEGALRFNDLATTEAALRRLDAIYGEYQSASDFEGQRLVRKLVLRGKQRAEGLAVNPRVSREKRQEKREIASWFRVWLQSPGLFFDWLAVRRQTDEFQRLFPSHPLTTSDETSMESHEG
ncbi:MAG TPA: hypothetical protein VL523_05070 [Terriglobia bacterium]|nr:hypothetical protein [Terriglobia bacterium]